MKNIFLDKVKKVDFKKLIFSFLGFVLLLLVWQIASIFMHEIIIASPYQAFSELLNMFKTNRFWEALFITFKRAVIGITFGSIIGFILGVFSGLNQNIKNLFEPMRWMIMSISPIIVVVIAMLWFGMGSKMVIVITAILLAPIVYVNTIKGIEMVDERLIEMSNVYKYSIIQKLKHIYIPALVGPLSVAMTIVITSGMRIIVLAELLGTNNGIGYEISFARTNMNTPELFAWVIVTLSFVGMAEYLIFKPVENYLLRWKN